jgi:hypothetical protein
MEKGQVEYVVCQKFVDTYVHSNPVLERFDSLAYEFVFTVRYLHAPGFTIGF